MLIEQNGCINFAKSNSQGVNYDGLSLHRMFFASLNPLPGSSVIMTASTVCLGPLSVLGFPALAIDAPLSLSFTCMNSELAKNKDMPCFQYWALAGLVPFLEVGGEANALGCCELNVGGNCKSLLSTVASSGFPGLYFVCKPKLKA